MCDLAWGCLSLHPCRIPPDLTQEFVLGDDEGRIWYWPLEIVDIPSPGGTKRHFCFPWSPSSGLNAASCNLSLEPSKTLRHLMTLQGRLSSPWRAGGRGRRGGGGCSNLEPLYCIHIQLSSASGGKFNAQPWWQEKHRTAAIETLDRTVLIRVSLSQKAQRRRPGAHREVIVHPIGRWGF